MPRIRPTNLRVLILPAVLAMVGSSSLAEKNSTEQAHAASIARGIALPRTSSGCRADVVAGSRGVSQRRRKVSS
jgi:hypothetical protein